MAGFPTIDYARSNYNANPSGGKYSAAKKELRRAAESREQGDADNWAKATAYIMEQYNATGAHYNWSDLDTQIRVIDHFDALRAAPKQEIQVDSAPVDNAIAAAKETVKAIPKAAPAPTVPTMAQASTYNPLASTATRKSSRQNYAIVSGSGGGFVSRKRKSGRLGGGL